ncbi:MAG: repeat protein [Paenibacillaceae bacterium]|nr:repeat protein [Paenibacillaceae bacterium]
MKATKAAKIATATLLALLILTACTLLLAQREDRIDLLFAANGDVFDQAAYDNFNQTLAANVQVHKKSLAGLSLKQLKQYDSVYLDYNLKHSETVRNALVMLMEYVKQGGHLFLENDFAQDFPPEFLGAAQITAIPPPGDIQFEYPEADLHLQGIQEVFRLFVDSFASQNAMTDIAAGTERLNSLPGYQWGSGIVPSTAQTLVSMNQLTIMSANRYGQGSVLLSSALLPTHYYITGFDLESGMDAGKGFDQKVKQAADNFHLDQGGAYFRFKNGQEVQPYFQFSFATANYQLRNAYLAYVSKEKLGYSVTKVHGPYGRPAMAYQNHLEVASSFRNDEGIQWAELLKSYNQIPSFSLVRSSYEWNEWYEDVTVHLNKGTQEQPAFAGQLANSFYGSGVRLSGSGRPLSLLKYPVPTELGGKIADPYRAYPAFGDMDGDGRPDLITGSADGKLSFFPSLGASPEAYANQPFGDDMACPDAFGDRQPVLAADGSELQVAAGYAAPAVADLNGDGLPDLVIGDRDGRIWLALNLGGQKFAAPLPLVAGGKQVRVGAPGSEEGYAAPAFGDYNGDGVLDLLAGNGDGQVYGFPGQGGKDGMFGEGRLLLSHTSRFSAPSVRDMNGDGVPDLVIGSQDGDLTVYLRQQDGSYQPDGTVDGETLNQVNTRALVGGHNSVPLWYDINHDGKDDLIVGQLEFGLPIPLDDPVFPYKDKVKQFVEYAQAQKLELVPHLFFHSYLSDEQEKQELALHRRMFDNLGIPWNATGTNQHTWRINNADRLQTLRNENAADIWYNFGFRPPNDPLDPQYSQDYVWSMPFLLTDDQLKQPMLLSSPGYYYRPKGSSYASEVIYEAFAKLDMPIIYFDHIEYKLPARIKSDLLPYVQYLDVLRNTYSYNFMTEPQLARSALVTLKSKVSVKQSYGTYLLTKLKNWLGRGEHLNLTLTADTSEVPDDLAGAYKNTLGIAIEPGKPYLSSPFGVNGDIYASLNGVLYTGLPKPTKLSINWAPEKLHLLRSNVPFQWTEAGDTVKLDLLADGMQQIQLYSPEPLKIGGDHLKVEHDEGTHTYTVTHYGGQTTVTLEPSAE